MINSNDTRLLEKLNLEYPAIAIKFCLEKPDAPHYEGEKLAFCQYLKYAQDTKKHFYITSEDDACYGKLSLGMEDLQPVTASGEAGKDFGCFDTQMPNRLLYKDFPMLPKGTIRYVEYEPAITCKFKPDLIFFVCNNDEADIVMRATSYFSGDLWESKSTPVLSCTWMYAYPIVAKKMNYVVSGIYHGMKRRKSFPAGLRMISVPFNKFPEFFRALDEMDWTLISFREDKESKEELARRMQHWQDMAAELNSKVDLK